MIASQCPQGEWRARGGWAASDGAKLKAKVDVGKVSHFLQTPLPPWRLRAKRAANSKAEGDIVLGAGLTTAEDTATGGATGDANARTVPASNPSNDSISAADGTLPRAPPYALRCNASTHGILSWSLMVIRGVNSDPNKAKQARQSRNSVGCEPQEVLQVIFQGFRGRKC
jgi:hypothetical protein